MPANMDPEREDAARRIAESDTTKSDKIRALARLDFPRAEIAKRLGLRYQHVRNVLVADAEKRAGQSKDAGSPDRRVADLTRGLTTTADRIRALEAAGYERADIARALGIRYQHVRNTLVRGKSDQTPGFAEARSEWEVGQSPSDANDLRPMTVNVAKGGRVTLPPQFRQAVGIADGDEVLLRVEDGEIRVYSRAKAFERVQDLVAKHVPADVSLVDELIAERRLEAERENRDG